MSKRKLISVVLAVLLLVGAGSAYLFRADLKTALQTLSGADYTGSGAGSVSLVINPGDSGEAVAHNLVELGVTKDFSFTYQQVIARKTVFEPGTFSLHQKMSVDSALKLIGDPRSRNVLRITIREGLRLNQVLQLLSDKTGTPLNEFESAVADPTAYGLPANIPNMDGYLFPATYDIAPHTKASEVIRMMVDRMSVELKKYGVSDADRHKVLTLASIVQREARATGDFYKVARVFQNRLDAGMPLQSCATISYFTGGSSFTNTAAQRATKNPYNTYMYAGLPIGPIGAPGSLAIDAALHPAAGSWLYFVAVNLKTGETVFSNTYAEHLQAVSRWDAWLRQNPEWIGK
jgi:UPF0755 protein